MDPRPTPGRVATDDRGFASLQFVLAAGLAMLMVAGLVQFVAYQYTRGAVVAALERGVRAGAVSGADDARCHGAMVDSLAEVLGGEVGESLEFGCAGEGDHVRAWATGEVPAWFPGFPDLAFDVEAIARQEPEP